MLNQRLFVCLVLLATLACGPLWTQSSLVGEPTTQRHLLSGSSPEGEVAWQFAKGLFANSPEEAASTTWSTITVPSNWEFEPVPALNGPSSQGTFSYGRGRDRKDEKNRKKQLSDVGTYRHVFLVPEHLLGTNRRFLIHFEGVMTDTRVFLNGQHLSTTQGEQEHHGGFVPFSYDVTSVLRRHEPNELIVAVREESSNLSVNRAERDADYWLFGGIFRPVSLLSMPARTIEAVAVDAKANGQLRVEVAIGPTSPGPLPNCDGPSKTLHLSLQDPRTGQSLAHSSAVVTSSVTSSRCVAHFDLIVPNVLPWSAQSPTLYRLELTLGSARNNPPQHQVSLNIGFRTIEVRLASARLISQDPDRAGLFVNGERTILRGINRHSFWPETGRALSRDRNRKDVELIKQLGFNAVRSSHYPPDQAFLDACDELGLYVIDELPGWHDAYDTNIGSTILRSMLERDRNHPSILLWANGNEGGSNPSLEPLFTHLDLQQRPVLRPDSLHGSFDTRHYPTWLELEHLLEANSSRNRFHRPFQPAPLILPTEMLHGLYDGGGAASLEQYWERLSTSPRFAGGFLWALLDEGVVRIDQAPIGTANGSLHHPIDTAGNYAPDGILGPFREPSASSRGIVQIFKQRRFQVPPEGSSTAETSSNPPPNDPQPSDPQPLSNSAIKPAVNSTGGALEITHSGVPANGRVTLVHQGTPAIEVTFSRGDSAVPGLARLAIEGRTLPLAGGRWRTSADQPPPHLVGERFEQSTAPRGNDLERSNKDTLRHAIETVGHHQPWPEEDNQLLSNPYVRYTQTFEDPDHSIRWTLDSSGIQAAVLFSLTSKHDWAGLQFDLSPPAVKTFVWQGLGPDRVWRNRMTGIEALWRADYPGEHDPFEPSITSLTTGETFSNVGVNGIRQANESCLVFGLDGFGLDGFGLDDEDSTLPLGLSASGAGTIGLLEPTFPTDARLATAKTLPGLTFYSRAPSIGTKFYRGSALQPLPKASTQQLQVRLDVQPPPFCAPGASLPADP